MAKYLIFMAALSIIGIIYMLHETSEIVGELDSGYTPISTGESQTKQAFIEVQLKTTHKNQSSHSSIANHPEEEVQHTR